jgi:hypothetical protein
MANNLSYSKLTYSDILNQIKTRLNADPQFQTFKESSAATMVLELFSGMTDMINYYIERRAEESYLETAKLRSSVIQLSKQLGYVIKRPIPASTTISMTLNGSSTEWAGVVAGESISIPIYSSFTYGSNKFIIKNSYTYTFTADDISNLAVDGYTKTIQYGLLNNETNYNLYKDEELVDEDDLITIDLIQAEKKYEFISESDNNQIGKKFQAYNISDSTFSNLYGSSDYSVQLTRVAISNDSENVFETGIPEDVSDIEYEIDRRSLLQTGQDFISVISDPKKVCLMRTNIDETIDIVFGDGMYAEIGASESARNISIQYISTLGSKANEIGIVGNKITYNSTLETNQNSVNVTALVNFKLTSNIIGGADTEDTESIRLNAPGIYYSLDRCVTNADYIAFLKSLTSPIIVKNAIAWGEQEEGGDKEPIEKLFNVALFSCFGEIYKYNSVNDEWTAKDSDTSESGEMSDSVLDDIDIFGTSTPISALAPHHYFKVLTCSNSPGNARRLEQEHLSKPTSKLGSVYTDLKYRSQMTVSNLYVSPIIQEYSLVGTIFVNKMLDVTETTRKIKNDVYSYLNENADYNVPVYLSNLIEVIENKSGILYSNVSIEPTEIDRTELGVSGSDNVYTAVSESDEVSRWINIAAAPDQSLNATIASTFNTSWTSIIPGYTERGTDYDQLDSLRSHDMEDNDVIDKSTITEYWFWNTLAKKIYDDMKAQEKITIALTGFSDSAEFDALLVKARNLFYYAIRYNIMSSGDILNFTMKTELPKITFEAGVMYK